MCIIHGLFFLSGIAKCRMDYGRVDVDPVAEPDPESVVPGIIGDSYNLSHLACLDCQLINEIKHAK